MRMYNGNIEKRKLFYEKYKTNTFLKIWVAREVEKVGGIDNLSDEYIDAVCRIFQIG